MLVSIWHTGGSSIVPAININNQGLNLSKFIGMHFSKIRSIEANEVTGSVNVRDAFELEQQ